MKRHLAGSLLRDSILLISSQLCGIALRKYNDLYDSVIRSESYFCDAVFLLLLYYLRCFASVTYGFTTLFNL